MKEFNIKSNRMDWSHLVDYVRFVVENSFDDDGNYHSFKRDYYETVALLNMFTDYDGEYKYDEIMEFRFGNKWSMFAMSFDQYPQFNQYIDDEIQRIIAPFADVNQTVREVKTLAKNINGILNTISENINAEAIKNIDFTSLINAIDAYNKIEEKADNNTGDNIVEFANKDSQE